MYLKLNLIIKIFGVQLILSSVLFGNNCYGQIGTNWNFQSGNTGWNQAEIRPASQFYPGGNPGNWMAEIDLGSFPSQTVSGFVVGRCYRISFDAQRRPLSECIGGAPPMPSQFTVDINNGALNEVVTCFETTPGMQNYEFIFTATSANHILMFSPFGAMTNTSCGVLIDNVLIQEFLISGTISASSLAVCQYKPSPVVTFNSLNVSPSVVYTYSINGGPINTITSSNNSNSASISIPTQVSGTFNVILHSVFSSEFECSSPVNQQVTVVVNPVPNVNAGPDLTICEGTQVTLSGSGANSYSWTPSIANGVAFAPNATTTYTLTGTDINGCSNSDEVEVVVNPMPTVNAGADIIICEGSQVMLNGSGANTYSWTPTVSNGVAFTPITTTTYTLTGTNSQGCTDTDEITVVVNPSPTVNAGQDITVCDGEQVTLNGTGASSYSWNPSIENGVAFTPSTTATYTLTGTDVNGCSNSDVLTVTVNPNPLVNAGSDLTICSGSQISLNGSGANTYSWLPYAVNGVEFTPSTTSTYTVIGTDMNGCTNTDQVTVVVNSVPTVNAGADVIVCEGSQVTLTGSGASSYSWNPSIENGVAFIPSSTTTYTLTGTDINGCLSTDILTVTVNPVPVVSAGSDLTICEGTQISLNGSGASSYSWSPFVPNGVAFIPSSTTTYTLTGTNNFGCTSSDEVNVIVNPLPSVSAGNDVIICQGTQVSLTGTGAITYSWNPSIENGVSFIPNSSTTYTLSGTDINGCTNMDQVAVIVNPNPEIVISEPFNDCSILSHFLTIETDIPVSTCNWVIGGTNIAGNSTGNFNIQLIDPRCYDLSVNVVTDNGCSSNAIVQNQFCVYPNPQANFHLNDYFFNSTNANIVCFNESIGSTSYQWDFGDDFTSVEENPSHVYSSQIYGSYEVELIAYNDYGCSDTSVQIIQINEDLVFYVPNTFTPDNDQFNNFFVPVFSSGYDPYNYSLLIFNRWGEILFESHDVSVGWDGFYGGMKVQDGTYTWKIAVGYNNKGGIKQLVGHVNVIN